MLSKRCLVAALALLVLLFSVPELNSAQSNNQHSLQWEQYYNEAYQGNEMKALIQTIDGGYAFVAPNVPYGTGVAPSVILYKVNSTGSVEWQKEFDGSTTIAGLAQTSDGSYVTVVNGDLVKVDSSGNMQWRRSLFQEWRN